ncbi:MAG: hypothetical protein IJ043_00285 [Clostridia bacterium]|nr:hypothetical protein [Clostridia bacterium]
MKPLIYGHRGSRTRRPENTMLSYRLAYEEGADGIEIDIRTTADGEIVISHDDSLKRCAGIDMKISDLTWDVLSTIPVHCPDKFGPTFMGSAFIPRLEEVFDWLKNNHCLINIEVKRQLNREYGYIEKKTLDMIKAYGLEERVIFSSFDEYILLKLKELDPAVKTCWLFDTAMADAGKRAKEMGNDAINPSIASAEQYDDLDKAVELGLDVNVWTVNDLHTAQRLAAKGATGLITDLPRELCALFAE